MGGPEHRGAGCTSPRPQLQPFSRRIIVSFVVRLEAKCKRFTVKFVFFRVYGKDLKLQE